jgi:CO/xanthine dehydrogenase Mo-binding subunit
MLHMAVLRSPFAHAKITNLDVSGALEQPGVVAAFTGEDLAREWGAGAGEAEQAPGYALLIDELPGGGGEVTESRALRGGRMAQSVIILLIGRTPT